MIYTIASIVALSLAGSLFMYRITGHVAVQNYFIKSGLFGKDMHRNPAPTIPESMGVMAGLVFLVVQFLFIPVPFLHWIPAAAKIAPTPEDGWAVFPFDRLATYLSALLSLSCMLFLGFADDVFDLRWRFKLLLPTIASIPLLMVYFVTYGVTYIVIPRPLRFIFGPSLDLGVIYYGYMGMLAVFCTNSINILAGINGVEVGQTIIIACSILLNDLLYISPLGLAIVDKGSLSPQTYELHLFSFYLMFPFLAISVALFLRNKYPAQVFVGDTFCYFSGMTFAVVGILGRFSKTLLLFFIPQIFNFLYSIPQLFRFVPCPRHRMPAYDPDTNLLRASFVELGNKKDHTVKKGLSYYIGHLFLSLFYMFGLVKLENRATEPKKRSSKASSSIIVKNYLPSENYTHCNNLTLLNLVLIRLGPMSERSLCNCLMLIQLGFGGLLAFTIRYGLVGLAYP